MKKAWLCGFAGIILCMSTSAYGTDWNQWRGPERNGIVSESPSLIDVLPETGPPQLWKSEAIPGGNQGGWASVSVADGKAYLYCNWEYKAPIRTRVLSKKALEGLGWNADMPEPLRQKVEEARTSEERAGLAKDQVRTWAKEWLEKNVPEEVKKFRSLAQRRLLAGKDALPTEVLAKLDAIKDKEFADEAALDRWFARNEMENRWVEAVKKVVPTTRPAGYDKLYCVDTATGMTIWQVTLPGNGESHPNSSTPCVVDGRCYVEGSDGNVYCFDANTGYDVWKVRPGISGSTLSSSFVVLDGKAVLQAGALTAFDLDTGKVLWKQDQVKGVNPSPAYWHTGGKTYLVCNGGKVSCVDPDTGEVLWSVPGGGNSSPAIVGDTMAILTNDKKLGLVAYKLSLTEPKQLWTVEFTDRGASPLIYEGCVYAVGENKAICVRLESGEVAWQEKLSGASFSSVMVADGKLIAIAGDTLVMIEATPRKFNLLGKAKLGTCALTSPALVDGRLYLRLKEAIASFDLRR